MENKIIEDFILFLESDKQKYKFKNGGWNYAEEISNFFDYSFANEIILLYDNAAERDLILNKDIKDMSILEIRKYIYAIFRLERFSEGLVMSNIKNGKLLLATKRLKIMYNSI